MRLYGVNPTAARFITRTGNELLARPGHQSG